MGGDFYDCVELGDGRLGLMPGMHYEESTIELAPGDHFEKQCVDGRLQWGMARNIRQNVAIRSLLVALARPLRRV